MYLAEPYSPQLKYLKKRARYFSSYIIMTELNGIYVELIRIMISWIYVIHNDSTLYNDGYNGFMFLFTILINIIIHRLSL